MMQSSRPDWSEPIRDAVGIVLAPALFFRAAVHVVTAAATDRDPRLSEDTDVTLSSPVPGLRDDKHDALARLGSAAFALVFAYPFANLATAGLAGAWLTLNWSVLLADPLAGLAVWTWQEREQSADGFA